MTTSLLYEGRRLGVIERDADAENLTSSHQYVSWRDGNVREWNIMQLQHTDSHDDDIFLVHSNWPKLLVDHD